MTDPETVVTLEPIGYVASEFRSAIDAPPQAADRVDAVGRVVVRPKLAAGLLGLNTYPYLWLLTLLDRQPEGSPPLTLVPRATERTGLVQGVFASRSPQRPCPVGLSLVRQVSVIDNVVTFQGVDLLDGTPVLDLKPWFADCDLPTE